MSPGGFEPAIPSKRAAADPGLSAATGIDLKGYNFQ
jgi:hypothetical protein